MATKKYLSLNEASEQLNLPTEKVVKLREEGRLRGFADRGTWKFKADDIEEYARSNSADSAPDVPIIDDEDDSVLTSQGGERFGSGTLMASSSIMADDPGPVGGDEPTVIRSGSSGSSILDEEPIFSSSDSDVRLFRDSEVSKIDSSPDVMLRNESDSDVRLMGDDASFGASTESKSDSDVQLADKEENLDTISDVRLLGDEEPTALTSGSDSDVALVSPNSHQSPDDGGSIFDDEDLMSSVGDSGIALESLPESGIALADSGTRIGDDSGIALSDSGQVDSGIALSDSGAGDSGIALSGDSGGDSGIALEALNEGMGPSSHVDPTEFSMDAAGDDSEFELGGSDDSAGGDDTSVILFDDDESSFEIVSPSGSQMSGGEAGDSIVDVGEDYDEFDEVGSSVVMEDDEMEFEAADEDFDDGFQTGESAADFAPAQQGLAVSPEPEIGGLALTGLIVSTALMAICGMMMFDLVRSIWAYQDPMVSSWILDATKGLL